MDENSYTVIGSGINSYFFIKTLLKRKIKVNLVDKNIINFEQKKNKENRTFKNNISPKVYLNNFERNIQEFIKKNNFVYSNFNTQSALSFGGLSNIWGGSIYKFNKHDLYRNNLQNESIFKYLKELKSYDLKIEKNLQNKFFEKNLNTKNYEIVYNWKLINHSGKPFSAQKEILHLIKSKKINFIPGILKKIDKKINSYNLTIDNGNKIFKLKTSKLILGAGSLSTTKLLMKLMQIKKVRLLCTPLTQQVVIASQKRFGTDLSAILSLNEKKNTSFSCHLIPLSGLDNELFLDHLNLNKFFFNSLITKVKPYLYAVYSYLNSDYSNITIENLNDKFLVKGFDNDLDVASNHKFFNSGIFNIPGSKKKLLQGNDNHIGGSFPLKEYFTGLNELKKYKNLHVIDGTYLNYIPALGYTLTTILNSIRIAKKI